MRGGRKPPMRRYEGAKIVNNIVAASDAPRLSRSYSDASLPP
jgi:hypothetical protein